MVRWAYPTLPGEALARAGPRRVVRWCGRLVPDRPKYVVSGTLADAEATWGPVTVVRGDLATEVGQLKEQPGRELQIHGSTTLGRSLVDLGLVDEIRLVVAPVIVGDGRRLFEPSDHATGLRLVDHRATPGGLLVQTYQVEGPARFDTYDPARDHGAEPD